MSEQKKKGPGLWGGTDETNPKSRGEWLLVESNRELVWVSEEKELNKGDKVDL